jgi:hypothetical protein
VVTSSAGTPPTVPLIRDAAKDDGSLGRASGTAPSIRQSTSGTPKHGSRVARGSWFLGQLMAIGAVQRCLPYSPESPAEIPAFCAALTTDRQGEGANWRDTYAPLTLSLGTEWPRGAGPGTRGLPQHVMKSRPFVSCDRVNDHSTYPRAAERFRHKVCRDSSQPGRSLNARGGRSDLERGADHRAGRSNHSGQARGRTVALH